MFIGLASLRLEPGLAQAQHSQRGPSGDFRLEPCWLGITRAGRCVSFVGTGWLPLLECLVVDLVCVVTVCLYETASQPRWLFFLRRWSLPALFVSCYFPASFCQVNFMMLYLRVRSGFFPFAL